MRTIIAGSRSINDIKDIEDAVKLSGFNITSVVSGCASGADYFGEKWAKNNKIKLVLFPADWKRYGKSAGYKRNVEMAKNADALIAIWDGSSKGTKHMIDIATSKQLQVFVYRTDKENEKATREP